VRQLRGGGAADDARRRNLRGAWGGAAETFGTSSCCYAHCTNRLHELADSTQLPPSALETLNDLASAAARAPTLNAPGTWMVLLPTAGWKVLYSCGGQREGRCEGERKEDGASMLCVPRGVPAARGRRRPRRLRARLGTHTHTHLAARVLLRGRGGRAQQCQRCRCEGALHHGVLWSGGVGSKVLGTRRWGADDGRNSGVRHSGLRTTCGLATRASALKGKFRLETAAPKRSRSALGRHQGSPGSTKYHLGRLAFATC
jgi:hypothetical protein